MTLEDPFFVVKDEVCKALSKTRNLFQRWLELQASSGTDRKGLTTGSNTPGRTPVSSLHTPTTGGLLLVGTPVTAKEEFEWTCTELRNSLRSIEWDLEDLEETIGIVEKNPRKFRLDASELTARKSFIFQTKEEVKCVKNRLIASERETNNKTNLNPSSLDCGVEITTHNSPVVVRGKMAGGGSGGAGGSTRYSRLVNQADDSPAHEDVGQYPQAVLQQQQMVMAQQDEQLDELASSMSVLKQMSRQVGQEVDEQAVMLDEFAHEMEHTQSKMDNTLNKIAKVMHLTNDRRQWAAIGILTCMLIVVILLFILL